MAFDAPDSSRFHQPQPKQNEVPQVLGPLAPSATSCAFLMTKNDDENDNGTKDTSRKRTITTSEVPKHHNSPVEFAIQSSDNQVPFAHQPSHQLEKSKPSKVLFTSSVLTAPASQHTAESTWDGNLGDGQWAVDGIVAHEVREDGIWCCIQFSGIDPDTGEKWAPKWESSLSVGWDLKADYHARMRA